MKCDNQSAEFYSFFVITTSLLWSMFTTCHASSPVHITYTP